MTTDALDHRLLRALLDTAADLAELADTESVLASIVRRTRALVGTDMAYLSLNDHAAGETYIRRAEGVVTHAYRTIRMPIGTGVLGKVAEGLAPFQSLDYSNDPTITHIPQVDHAVQAEGVHAIMGSPLVVDGRPLGALMVAERRARRFTHSEVTIVESLAKHAAIAIQNAHRYTEALNAAGRADADRDHERESLRELTRLDELSSRQCQSLLEEPNETAVLNRAAEHLGVEVELLSPERPTSPLRPAPTLPSRHTAGVAHEVEAPDGCTWTLVPADRDARDWLAVRRALDPAEEKALLRTAQHLLLARRLRSARRATELEAGAGLLAELVDDSAGGIVRRRRALAELGLREDSQVSLVVIDLAAVPEPQFAERVLSPVAGVRLSAPRGGTWCVVGDRPDVPARVEAAVRHATEAVWQMAFLGPGEHFRDLPGAFHTLENALAVSRVAGGLHAVDASTVGAVGMVLAGAGEASKDVTARPLAPLRDLPPQRASALRETALAYLDAGMNVAETSRRLFLHRNTVLQRLEQLGAVLGSDWHTPPRSLDLHLALLSAARDDGGAPGAPPARSQPRRRAEELRRSRERTRE